VDSKLLITLETSSRAEDNEDWTADADGASPVMLLTILSTEDTAGSAVISDCKLERTPLA
jgi:hypothetical protein